MSYESLRSIFVYTGIASLILAGVALLLFFVLRIPDAVAYLSGKARRRGIEQIRRESSSQEENGTNRNKKTNKAKNRPQKEPKKKTPEKKTPAGNKQEMAITDRLNKTHGDTELLEHNLTEVLNNDANMTTVLSQDQMDGTMLLSDATDTNVNFVEQSFCVEFEITFLNSDVELDLEV